MAESTCGWVLLRLATKHEGRLRIGVVVERQGPIARLDEGAIGHGTRLQGSGR